VKPELLATVPPITPFFQNAEGGLPAVLNAMRFATEEPEITAFLHKYDSIPESDRVRLSWEAIALAANVNLRTLAGAVLFALRDMSVSTVKMIAFSNHPKVMKATVDYALMPSGDRDRTMVHRGLGFLPDPKGPTFIGKAVFGPSGAKEGGDAETQAATFSGDDELEELFPSSKIMQEKLVPLRQRLLE